MESISRMKDNYEKLSQDYMKRNEDLEKKYEQLIIQNNELNQKIKKLELAHYDGIYTSYNNGLKLDAILMTDAGNEEIIDKNEEYKGFMRVNMNPPKAIQKGFKKPGPLGFTRINNEILTRDINMITNNILQKKEMTFILAEKA